MSNSDSSYSSSPFKKQKRDDKHSFAMLQKNKFTVSDISLYDLHSLDDKDRKTQISYMHMNKLIPDSFLSILGICQFMNKKTTFGEYKITSINVDEFEKIYDNWFHLCTVGEFKDSPYTYIAVQKAYDIYCGYYGKKIDLNIKSENK